MSSFCPGIAAQVDRRREGELAPAEQARLETHLAACSTCREEAALTEPLRLFTDLVRRPLPPGTEHYILGGLRVAQHRRRPAWHWLPAAIAEPLPVFVSLLAVAVLLVVWAFQGGRLPAPGVREPLPWAALERMDPALPPYAMTNAVETVEDIQSTTAEILAFSLPGDTGPTEVILIVDRSIDL
jgi:hypothetical protein